MFWHVLFPEDFEEDILETHFTEPGRRQPQASWDLHPQAAPPGQAPSSLPALLAAVGHHVLPADPQENHLLQQPPEQESLSGPTSERIKTVNEIRSNFLQTMKKLLWVSICLLVSSVLSQKIPNVMRKLPHTTLASTTWRTASHGP